MIGRYHKHSLHYLLPAFPAFILVASASIASLLYRDGRIIRSGMLLLLLIITPSIYHTTIYGFSFLKQDTRVAARNWILKNKSFGSVIAVGRTVNAPPLPDINRFNKEAYSMYSEQVLTEKLPEALKRLYLYELENKSYEIINYVIKSHIGRQKTYSEMMASFELVSCDIFESSHVDLVIFSSSDSRYLRLNGYADIVDVPCLASRLRLERVFTSDGENLRGPDISIFSLNSG
jgi:hypothetical protein